MKNLSLLFCWISSTLFSQSWIQLNNIGNNVTCSTTSSPPVRDAACLSINGKIYLFAGREYTTSLPNSSVWEYNPVNDSWCYKSDYPGNGQIGLSAFSIGNIAYIGCGYSYSSTANSDFFKYEPATNIWTPLANIPVARNQACGFSIGTKGYFCCGASMSMATELNDLWEYNVSTNTWTQKANFPDSARYQATAFSNSNFGFVGLGYGSSHWFNTFYKYNPQTNAWSNAPAFPGDGRCGAGVVTANNHAYILCGNKAMTVYNDCYDFNFNSMAWNNLPVFNGSHRSAILCGTNGNALFAGGGSAAGGGMSFEDWWTFQSPLSAEEKTTITDFITIHQTGENSCTLYIGEEKLFQLNFQIFTLEGKLITSGLIEKSKTPIELNNKGLYFLKIGSGKSKPIKFILL